MEDFQNLFDLKTCIHLVCQVGEMWREFFFCVHFIPFNIVVFESKSKYIWHFILNQHFFSFSVKYYQGVTGRAVQNGQQMSVGKTYAENFLLRFISSRQKQHGSSSWRQQHIVAAFQMLMATAVKTIHRKCNGYFLAPVSSFFFVFFSPCLVLCLRAMAEPEKNNTTRRYRKIYLPIRPGCLWTLCLSSAWSLAVKQCEDMCCWVCLHLIHSLLL